MDNYIEKRAEIDDAVDGLEEMQKEFKQGFAYKCKRWTVKAKCRDGYEMDILCTAPWAIAQNKNSAAYIYGHGGGGFAGSAAQSDLGMS